ncbi:MAG: hypothetical protein AB7R55_21695 [Gemmatimonadales bacterium]
MDGVSLALTVGLGTGVANGCFVTSMLVAGPRPERRKRLVLAAIVACLTLSAAEELVARAGFLALAPHAIGATLTLDYLLAPLLWAYARSLVRVERPLRPRDLIHLGPFSSPRWPWCLSMC